MKRFLILLIANTILLYVRAQQAEPIYSNGRVSKPNSYYKLQVGAWKKVIDENPKNAKAWYYYYYANRNLYMYNDTSIKLTWEEKNAIIKKLLDDMGKAIPDSYEYNLCMWMAGGFDLSLIPYLDKAAALGEDRTEHLDFMVNIGEIKRDNEKKLKYEKKKYDAGLFSTGIMYYNYNVISGMAENGILLALGDNDTYPVWALQSLGIRLDITVINLSLILIDEYREKLFKELGIVNMKINWNGGNDSAGEVSYQKFQEEIIKHIASNSKKYPVYVPLTLAGSESYLKQVKENLYLTGLAYQHSKASVDNLALMKRNFEQHYTLDYIENAFYQDISPGMVQNINRNYIVPMFKLYEHYKTCGDSQHQEWIKHKLLVISKDTEDEEEVKKELNQK